MAEQLLASPPGADDKLFKGRERRMVYGISLGGALVFSKRFAEAMLFHHAARRRIHGGSRHARADALQGSLTGRTQS